MKNTIRLISLGIISIFFSFFIISCGGGGGGGGTTPTPTPTPTAVITTDNVVEVAAEVFGSADIVTQGADTSQIALGVDVTMQNQNIGITDLIIWQVQDIEENKTELFSQTYVTGVIISDTVPCDEGSMSLSINDADNNDELSAGDSITATYNSCGINTSEGVFYYNGVMSMTFNSFSGDFINSVTFDVTTTFTNLLIDIPDDSAEVTGDMRLYFSFSGNNVVMMASGNSFSYTDVNGITRTLTNYTLDISSSDNMASSTLIYDGTLSDSQTLGGPIVFETVTPFTVTSTSNYPSSGQLIAEGGKPEGAQFASSFQLTVIDNGQVQLEVDSDGDGVYENSKTVDWTQVDL